MHKYIERARVEGKTIEEMGKILVDEYMDAGLAAMGMGQPQHLDGDPRAEPTHIKHEQLCSGVYLELQRSIEKHFNARRKKEGKAYVAVNMIGAGNTALAELGFSPNAAWCIGCVCRGFSCAAHATYTMKKGTGLGGLEARTNGSDAGSVDDQRGGLCRPPRGAQSGRASGIRQKTKRGRRIQEMDNLDDPRLMYKYRTREWGTVPMDEKRDRFQWVSEVAIQERPPHPRSRIRYDGTCREGLWPDGSLVHRLPGADSSDRGREDAQLCNGRDAGRRSLSSPANIARIVAGGKTILTQAAGSSILAFGHAYGAYQAFGKMLDGILAKQAKGAKSLFEVVESVVKTNLSDPALGVSNLMLKDPAAKRMIARAEKLGVAGKYVSLIKEVVKAAQKLSKAPVDIDLLGATGAVMFDLGFTPEATWGILSVTRAFATGAHYCEEIEREEPVRLGQALTPKDSYDGPEYCPVPALKERKNVAKCMVAQTPAEWKETFIERQKIKGSGLAIVEEIDDPKRKI